MCIKTQAFKYLLPLFAVGLAVFAVAHALSVQRPEPQMPPPVEPPVSPFGDTVAGAGLVEPSTEASGTGSIAVGSQLAGTVSGVRVHIGQEVQAGDLLFELDARLVEADLKVREANVAVSEAQVGVAESTLNTAKDQYERTKKSYQSGAAAGQDYVTAEQAYQSAQAQLAQAKATVRQVRAQVEQARTQLDVLRVRAPTAGTVLQVNVRPGEYVSTTGGGSRS